MFQVCQNQFRSKTALKNEVKVIIILQIRLFLSKIKKVIKKIPEMHDDFFSSTVDLMLVYGSASRSHLTEVLGQQEVINVSVCPAVIKHTVVKNTFNTDFNKCRKVIKNTKTVRISR